MNHPALNRTVIDLKAALHHDLFDIALRLRQVPTNALECHLFLKVSSFEADHVVAESFEKGAFMVPSTLVRC